MMLKYIYPSDGYSPPCVVDAIPVCGDYCDRCGDCLHCHAEDSCIDGGGHFWAVDEDNEAVRVESAEKIDTLP